jgi:intracellular sulfur oxidation DsrE/DsrF family protein
MRQFLAALAVVLAGFAAAPHAVADPDVRVAIHVDENDPQKMNIVLNNALNIEKHYAEQGKTVEIAIVAHGPGLTMFRPDKSPVKERIETLELSNPNIHLEACGNTIAGITKKEGAAPVLFDHAAVVPSGAVRLIELQQQGWAYLKP